MTRHVVVIDDCRTTLAMVSDYLADADFQVSTAECGVYSNHLIYGSRTPDLILLDVMMPLMSGEKKARLIKAAGKELPHSDTAHVVKTGRRTQVHHRQKRGRRLPDQTFFCGQTGQRH